MLFDRGQSSTQQDGLISGFDMQTSVECVTLYRKGAKLDLMELLGVHYGSLQREALFTRPAASVTAYSKCYVARTGLMPLLRYIRWFVRFHSVHLHTKGLGEN
jgi:hypothetical protein